MNQKHSKAERPYAGIGSRETPESVMAYMEALAFKLACSGFELRSGGARGADQAFQAGAMAAGGPASIYVPWRGFSKGGSEVLPSTEVVQKCVELAQSYHPAWGSLSYDDRLLMARNVCQVLGLDLTTPSRFVVCWTPSYRLDAQGRVCDGAGGTGLAIRLAYARGIPIFHLAVRDHAQRILGFVSDVKLKPPTTSVQQDLFLPSSMTVEPHTACGLVSAA